MSSVYNRVRAKVYFLTPEEGGRTRNVDLLHSRSPYILLADVGLGYTEDGFPLRGWARVELEGGPGYIELGVEQTVQWPLPPRRGTTACPTIVAHITKTDACFRCERSLASCWLAGRSAERLRLSAFVSLLAVRSRAPVCRGEGSPRQRYPTLAGGLAIRGGSHDGS